MFHTDLTSPAATEHPDVPWPFAAVRAARPDGIVNITWPARSGALVLHLAAVPAPAQFSHAWFVRHGIDLPPRIACSVPKRQAEYFAGRMCARAGIAALGIHHAQVGTCALGAPVWPAGLTGSISHTNAFAIATVVQIAGYQGIGIDLESVPGREGLDALRTVALNERERALIDSIGIVAQDILVTAVFSAKESFFKATAAAVGHYFDFSAIECVAVETDTLTCVIREPLTPRLQPGMLCRFDLAMWHGQVLTCFRW